MPFISRKKYCAEGKIVGFTTEVCSLQKIAVQFTLSTLNCLKGPNYLTANIFESGPTPTP